MEKVLMTGGSGRIARYMMPDFTKEYEVIVFDAIAPKDRNVQFVQGDITKLEDLVAATKGIDSIVHLAAIPIYTGEDAKIWRINVDGTFNVLEAAKINGAKHVVHTSSVCAWGVINWSTPFTPAYLPVDEEIPNLPDDMYGMGKLIGEHLCYAYSSRYGINTVALRVATVGLMEEGYWIEARQNIDNPEHKFKDFPLTLKDFLWQYVDPRDLSRAYLGALKAMREGRVRHSVYNIGARDVFSTVDTMELIRRYLPDVAYIKNKNGFLEDKFAPLFDISKAKNELGFNPQYTWRDFNP